RQHHLATRAFRAAQGVRAALSLPGGAKAGDTYLVQRRRSGGALMTLTGAEVLARHGIAAEPVPTSSEARFPDGAHFRMEIPNDEGPEVLRAVIDQAKAEDVTVNRVSQGSGAMLLSEAELDEMARIAADQGIEVSLFVGPREEWDVGSLAQ